MHHLSTDALYLLRPSISKVKSSALVPLMLVVSVCGAGVHVTGLTGLFLGYFTWSIGCEGVVTVTGDSARYFSPTAVKKHDTPVLQLTFLGSS